MAKKSKAPKGLPPVGAADFGSLLDATIEHGTPELSRNAAHIRSQMQMAEFAAAGDPHASSLLYLTGLINKSMASQGGLVGSTEFGAIGQRQPTTDRRRLIELYRIAEACSELQTAITNLRNEIFRRGLEWEPAFDWKCDRCGVTYTKAEAKQLKHRCRCTGDKPDAADPTQARPQQPSTPLRRPDPKELVRFDAFFKRANYFNQSFENILRICEKDINVVDDAFLYFRKYYWLTDQEEEQARFNPSDDDNSPHERVEGIFRLDPTLIQYDLSDRGIPGMSHHVCVFHRATILDVPEGEHWDVQWQGICPECGLRTYPIYYLYNEEAATTMSTSGPITLHLLRDEVIHWSRYAPTETYGGSPIFSIYEKALSLLGMDRFLYEYFFERKIPQGVVTVATSDVDGVRNQKAEAEASMMQNPHYIPWIAVDNKSGNGKMEYVRFGYTLDELDYLPVRDEIRERIAGTYGVSAIWMSDTGGSGGLNNESQQIVVTSRVVEGAQRSYHVDVFEDVEKQLNVTDWHLRLKHPEESSELASLQVKQAKAQWAATMQGMGFGVEYDEENDSYHITGSVPSAQEVQQSQSQEAPFGNGGNLMQPAGGPPGAPGMADQSAHPGVPSGSENGAMRPTNANGHNGEHPLNPLSQGSASKFTSGAIKPTGMR